MINEQMSHSEALKILGATGDESKAELSKLFKRASLRNHPDRGGSTELMQKINQAYDVVTKTNSAGKTYSDIRAQHAADKKHGKKNLQRISCWRKTISALNSTRKSSRNTSQNSPDNQQPIPRQSAKFAVILFTQPIVSLLVMRSLTSLSLVNRRTVKV